MKIKIITYQDRRDYTAIMECEGCGNEQLDRYGYDDRNYHDNVIPNIKCGKCNKSRNDLNITIEPTPTKYPEDSII